MTLTSQIISDAFRIGNLTAVEHPDPTDAEISEALRYLNRIVKSVFGAEAGEPLTAWPIGGKNIERPSGYPWYGDNPGGDWYVPKNFRLMFNLETAAPELWLHPDPDDGCRFAAID